MPDNTMIHPFISPRSKRLLRTITFFVSVGCLLVSPVACASSIPTAPPSIGSTERTSVENDSLIKESKILISEATDKGSLDSLKQARALAKQATASPKNRALAHYYAALANYRIGNQLRDDNEDQREQVLTDAISHLKRATTIDGTMADAWALLTGCYGQMMGMNPMKSMGLGRKSSAAMKKARTLAPKNPRVWIISGTQDYFTPSMFGGDKEQALEKFKKAARLAEQESIDDPLMPSWGHAEAYAWIGIAQMNAERYQKARAAFEKALDRNPDYGWVKSVLLPKLQEKEG